MRDAYNFLDPREARQNMGGNRGGRGAGGGPPGQRGEEGARGGRVNPDDTTRGWGRLLQPAGSGGAGGAGRTGRAPGGMSQFGGGNFIFNSTVSNNTRVVLP